MILPEAIDSLVRLAALFCALILIWRQVEKRFPIERKQAWSEIRLDYKLVAVTFFLPRLLSPLFAAASVMLVNGAGGGFIELRSDGWWFVVSVLIFTVTNDFFVYWLHRAQHGIPALWAMHSLHHSAEGLTFATGGRHFWFEPLLFGAFFPVLAILFKTPPEVATAAGIIAILPNGCAHLNLRLSLGRFALWIDNPQYHRIHHSVLPEHMNKNFASIFPLWDVVFGTVWKPGKDEFPPTGLVPSEKPAHALEGIFWPIRHWAIIRRLTTSWSRLGSRVIAKIDGWIVMGRSLRLAPRRL